MIKKCDHAGCGKAGTCRAPKSRDLKDYWYFCPEHAAEYNRNWNFYADMSADEIEADWEKQTFGTQLRDKDAANKDAKEYEQFIHSFIAGRAMFDLSPKPKSLPSKIVSALKVLELPISANAREIAARYRALAKQLHPDTARNKKDASADAFAKLADAYKTLQTYYKK
ncbi:MAG: J domain-containing protein [Rickettsiales bacterium]|jgi:DnaJ-domain-containing protein 1|nr:J domain-containing protein [Rickettsiales bacterium]